MLISYNWLRDLTDTKLTPLELRERLTMVGLAIDAIEEAGGNAVLDVEVPSNRPDCLSHIGVAREVAVIEKSKVENPKSKVFQRAGKASDSSSVEIEDEDLCPRYAARIIRGVKIGPSPDWLQKRLGEIGQRPINNVADITNYVLHEVGQPLHAFDLAKLDQNRIVVRRARAGEKLKTLDGTDRTLDQQMLVIADAAQPVALAGIMGGLDSEISSATTDVLIESAYFNSDSVRRTARQLGMDTEASRRFERGADCENVVNAQTRCVQLICEIAGGVATEDAIDVYPKPLTSRVVGFRPAKVEALTSLRVDVAEMKRILNALGFALQDSSPEDKLSFVVPSWRGDVSLEEDLVEEVARHTGYEKIASELPPSNLAGEYQPSETRRRSLRRTLNSLGFDEAIDFSFIAAAHDGAFELLPALQADQANGESNVTLKNPIIEDADRMRPTLLPGLLSSLRLNFNHGNRDVCLFEIGRIFASSRAGELPHEREALALIASGGMLEEGRGQGARETDFYRLKGALEGAADALRVRSLRLARAQVTHLREGQSAKILLADGSAIGTIGRLSESIANDYKFRQPVYVAEIDLTALVEAEQRSTQYTPLPRYPSVVRDLTLLVGREVDFASMVASIDPAATLNYAGVKLVGTYEGPNIPADKRSVTLRIEYRSNERTLRDEEVDERHQQLRESLVQKFDAELH
ncbi:MAG TPA: phenylalanine--tRNA ligase subunit beta [Pyrinomonadaceae bacterium]|nr:phenylalanine--tRNA ligase subunit beta [Pyrinomonadaceae bacterium]